MPFTIFFNELLDPHIGQSLSARGMETFGRRHLLEEQEGKLCLAGELDILTLPAPRMICPGFLADFMALHCRAVTDWTSSWLALFKFRIASN